MNNILRECAHNYLITNLNLLTEDNRRIFKLMYGRKNGKRSVEDAVEMNIEDVIMEMADDQLDWAMEQVRNTTAKQNEKRI